MRVSFLCSLALAAMLASAPAQAEEPIRPPDDGRYQVALKPLIPLIGARLIFGAARSVTRAPAALAGPRPVSAQQSPPSARPAAAPLRGAQHPNVRASLIYGQQMHRNYNWGPGIQREARLPSGRRMDAVDTRRRVIYELKPANRRAVQRGITQGYNYAREMRRVTGQEWTYRVRTYKPRRR